MSRFPSVAGLRALEAVARTGSLTRAAEELCVTPAAISHRLTELEAAASQPLLDRKGRRISPTDHGLRVIAALGDSLTRLQSAQRVLAGQGGTLPLRVAAPTSFVLGWLVEAIDRFHTRHPGLKIEIEPLDDPLTARSFQPDVVLFHGADHPRTDFLKLCDCSFRAVYNPDRLGRVLRGPSDLTDVALIRCDLRDGAARGAAHWASWLAAKSVARAADAPEIEVSQAYAALRMAMLGQGVALLTRHLTENALRQSAVQEVPGSAWQQGTALWVGRMVTLGDNRAAAQAFLGWLQEELALIYG